MDQARFFDGVRQPCPLPEGARVEVTGVMPDDPDPMPIGARGTVVGGNGSQLFVQWDNNRTMALLTSDPYRVIEGV